MSAAFESRPARPASSDAESCRQVIALHSRSFALAARLFPPAQRDAVSAVYAFCRDCDDAVDEAPPSGLPAALARLEARLDSIYADEPQPDAVGRRFQAVVRERRIPAAYPRALLEGMAMDVRGTHYATLDDLLLYAWRVAGTVGLMMCHVLGVRRSDALVHAAHLGMAMQLTNVCRDVAEDWERGRLYLPASLFDRQTAARLRHECGGAPPRWAEPALSRAVRHLLGEAERYYASGDAGMDALDPRAALAVRTARRVYAEIGREVERRGVAPFAGRAVVSTPRKLALLAGCLVRFARDRRARGGARLAPPEGVLDFGPHLRLSAASAARGAP